MSESRLRIETEDERERLHAARHTGEMCAACGRALDAGEPVYLERFTVVGTYVSGPVGRECASPDMLARTEGLAPERCAMCGRGVYYHLRARRRRQASCSRRCESRAAAARHRAARGRAG
jgi:hypothetical protein